MPDNPSPNRLLQSLPTRIRDRVLRHAERMELNLKDLLVEADRPIEHVYFPEIGVCSMVATGEADFGPDRLLIEVATVGREGFVGTPLLLGSNETRTMTLVQIPGRALRMPAKEFMAIVRDEPELQLTLLRYTQALIMQISQAATCNRLHNIEERAARWLLMTQDRVDENTFPLTQEFFGQMLGVRRQAVNVAAGMLQKAGMIQYTRGQITILDRKGLEATACECYRIIVKEFEKSARVPYR